MLEMAAGYEAMFQADIVLTLHLILFDKCRIVNFLLQTDFMYHVRQSLVPFTVHRNHGTVVGLPW